MCPSLLTSAASFQRRSSGTLGIALATATTSFVVTWPSPSTSAGQPTGTGVETGLGDGDGTGVGAGVGAGDGVGAGVGGGVGDGVGVGAGVVVGFVTLVLPIAVRKSLTLFGSVTLTLAWLIVARAANNLEPVEEQVTDQAGDVNATGVPTAREIPVMVCVPDGDLAQPVGAVRFHVT
jgi:hypothetical protein